MYIVCDDLPQNLAIFKFHFLLSDFNTLFSLVLFNATGAKSEEIPASAFLHSTVLTGYGCSLLAHCVSKFKWKIISFKNVIINFIKHFFCFFFQFNQKAKVSCKCHLNIIEYNTFILAKYNVFCKIKNDAS